jgi:hypothetical protein
MTRKPKTKPATRAASRQNKPSRARAATARKPVTAKPAAARPSAAKTPKRGAAKSRRHVIGEPHKQAIALSRDPIAALIAAGTQTLSLPLEPAWKDAVAFHLRLILRHAALVDGFELPDEAEPAPVFRA